MYAEIKVFVDSAASSWRPPEDLPEEGVVLSENGAETGEQGPPSPASVVKPRPRSDIMTMRKTCNVRWCEDITSLGMCFSLPAPTPVADEEHKTQVGSGVVFVVCRAG